MDACYGSVVIGMAAEFVLYNLIDAAEPPRKLVDPTDLSLQFIQGYSNVLQPVACVEISANSEFLLVFNTIGVFVNCEGRRTRKRDLVFPSPPVNICKFFQKVA